MTVLSVSQLNRYVKSVLEEDGNLKDLYLKGELSNVRDRYSSGHIYFVVKDEKASIRGIMFAGNAKHLKFIPKDGMEVLIRASAGLYEAEGSYQLFVTDMEPLGKGAVEDALKKLVEELRKAGLFSEAHKKKLPIYPETIGVVTSKTGAAIEDIKTVIKRRYPIAKIKFAPALVQGAGAPKSLISAVKALDGQCDVMIVGRGGGSKEDLSAFNDKELAYAIFGATTPVISAVGHEIDITICDLVADHRAPTPTGAAELATPSILEVKAFIDGMNRQIGDNLKRTVATFQDRLWRIETTPIFTNPMVFVEVKEKKLENLQKMLYNVQYNYFKDEYGKLDKLSALLESLSPFKVLSRGYAAVFKAGEPISSINQVVGGDKLTLQFSDGDAKVVVNSIEPKGRI